MSNAILDAIGDVGYLLDTPGAYLRGALSGQVGQRASGEDMLGSWGVDAGPVGGMAAELVADPLALAGLAGGAYKGIQGVTRAARGIGYADDANPLARAVGAFVGDEAGALRPFQEIGRRTDPDFVNTQDWFHGTATQGLTPQTLDPMQTKDSGLFGRGIYKTSNPEVAAGYSETRARNAPYPANYDELRQQLFDQRVAQAQLEEPGFQAIDMDWPHMEEVAKAFPDQFARQTLYQGNTNLGKILDLDDIAEDPFIASMRDYAGSASKQLEAPRSLSDWDRIGQADPLDVFYELQEQGRTQNTLNSDFIQAMLPSGYHSLRDLPADPLIKHLRETGYDALTHTGGSRAGRGKKLHDVLISLDPNDTISHVGRANQITRFEPQQIEDLMRQMRGLNG